MSYGVNSPWGLMPVKYMNGAAWSDQQNSYRLPSGYNANLYKYDPATVGTGGFAVLAAAGDGATVPNTLLGCFVSFQWVDVNGVVQTDDKWTAGTVTFGGAPAIAFVADDPMIIFNIQGAGNGGGNTGIADADLLRNASLLSGTGNNYSNLSGWTLDQTTIGTGVTKQLKIYRFVPTPDGLNVSGLRYNNVEVLINNHYYKAGVASI